MNGSRTILCALSIVMLSACGGRISGSIEVAKPLVQDMSRYRTMAVYFSVDNPSFEEGLAQFKPFAMRQIRAAKLADEVYEVGSPDQASSSDLLLDISIYDYVKSTAGVWVRGGLADQAKLIFEVILTESGTTEILTAGAVGAWTFDNHTNEQVAKHAAVNLRHFLMKEYNKK